MIIMTMNDYYAMTTMKKSQWGSKEDKMYNLNRKRATRLNVVAKTCVFKEIEIKAIKERPPSHIGIKSQMLHG